mmetsp:Transcript_23282/g.25662  ORF Transcript_23282/g.25662 Transcript_23282/m.25662 type:complete len:97 (+) Transcript_23282:341-631(+)
MEKKDKSIMESISKNSLLQKQIRSVESDFADRQTLVQQLQDEKFVIEAECKKEKETLETKITKLTKLLASANSNVQDAGKAAVVADGKLVEKEEKN